MTEPTATKLAKCDACTRDLDPAHPSASMRPHETLVFCPSCLEDYYAPCSHCKTPKTIRGFRFGKRQDQCWQRACAECVVEHGLKKKIDTSFMTTGEALATLTVILRQEGLEEEGLGMFNYGDLRARYQRPLNADGFNWIACYAVTGGNEGHYVHIDLIHKKEERQIIASIKTFMGMARAYKVAGRCAELLGA